MESRAVETDQGGEVKGGRVAVYVSEYPGGQIDKSARKVFESVGEEYEDLCDRLFADDPVFSYGSVEDISPE